MGAHLLLKNTSFEVQPIQSQTGLGRALLNIDAGSGLVQQALAIDHILLLVASLLDAMPELLPASMQQKLDDQLFRRALKQYHLLDPTHRLLKSSKDPQTHIIRVAWFMRGDSTFQQWLEERLSKRAWQRLQEDLEVYANQAKNPDPGPELQQQERLSVIEWMASLREHQDHQWISQAHAEPLAKNYPHRILLKDQFNDSGKISDCVDYEFKTAEGLAPVLLIRAPGLELELPLSLKQIKDLLRQLLQKIKLSADVSQLAGMTEQFTATEELPASQEEAGTYLQLKKARLSLCNESSNYFQLRLESEGLVVRHQMSVSDLQTMMAVILKELPPLSPKARLELDKRIWRNPIEYQFPFPKTGLNEFTPADDKAPALAYWYMQDLPGFMDWFKSRVYQRTLKTMEEDLTYIQGHPDQPDICTETLYQARLAVASLCRKNLSFSNPSWNSGIPCTQVKSNTLLTLKDPWINPSKNYFNYRLETSDGLMPTLGIRAEGFEVAALIEPEQISRLIKQAVTVTSSFGQLEEVDAVEERQKAQKLIKSLLMLPKEQQYEVVTRVDERVLAWVLWASGDDTLIEKLKSLYSERMIKVIDEVLNPLTQKLGKNHHAKIARSVLDEVQAKRKEIQRLMEQVCANL